MPDLNELTFPALDEAYFDIPDATKLRPTTGVTHRRGSCCFTGRCGNAPTAGFSWKRPRAI